MLHQNLDVCKAQFDAGCKAFKRGEFPQDDWSQEKRNGWNFAGENQFWIATANEVQAKKQDRSTVEYLPLDDAPGYSESLQPYLW